MKKIVILGAGYAGLLTAKKLLKHVRKRDDVQLTIIDKNRYHTMLTELHEVAAARVNDDSIRVNLRRIFAGRKIEIVLDTIEAIDYQKQVMTGHAGTYTYDYLVLASGSRPAFYNIPGAADHTLQLWSYEDAVALREHVQRVFNKAINEPDEALRRKLLTFYICGAGFTGVEMAGELAEWLPYLCAQYDLDPKLVRIIEVDMLDRIVPNLSPALSAKAQRRLEKMGVQIKLKTSVKSVGEDYIEYEHDGKLSREATETVIWTAGTQSSHIAQAATQMKQVGRGRLQTDAYLRAEGFPNVFVAGDNTFMVPEGSKTPVPQMVEHCEQSAGCIAHNLAAAVEGQETLKEYKPSFHGVMVSIGGRYGVAYVGTEKKKFSLPSFLAMFVKHFINITYFIQLLGWNKIFSYLKHEFFTIRNRRSFVGGHFSNRTPSFLLVPLRVFLGAMWVYEAVKKIGENWLSEPNLQGFFGGADAFFRSIVGGAAAVGDAAASATDATASATGAAEGGAEVAGQALINWNILGFLKIWLVKAQDIALKIDFSLMNAFRDSVILSSPGLQLFFQTVIVISELLIGLALIGGLATTLAAGYSIVLMALFLMTTGLYLSSWWMFFAAVAMLFGAGHIFGLDYYVMPWLKKQWKKLGFVRKSYLYHD